MSYRKFNADYLFTGLKLLENDHVLITDPEGKVIDIVEKKGAGDNIEIHRGLLSPGFINGHCHLELSHLKGVIPPKTGLVSFVQQVMSGRGAEEEKKLHAMLAAEQEMYSTGTVAVGDICNTIDSLTVKQNSKIKWHNFIEVSGFTDAFAEKRFTDAKQVAEKFSMLNSQCSIVPHAPYSVSKKLFELINDATYNKLITIHNQESEEENKLYENKSGHFLDLYKNFGIDISAFEPTGKTSLQSWLPYLNNLQSIISVHNTFISQADMELVSKPSSTVHRQLYFCLCPNANKYIENKMPPIELLRKNEATIILGTDSYASNWQLNLLEEIKTIQHETAYSMTLQEILKWATMNGAKALRMDDQLGSFEKNKTPGIVLIDQMNGSNTTSQSSAKRLL